jgi:PmbA protein
MRTDLSELVQRVISWSGDNEQVEAYAAHSRDTEVDVYQGGIETLSTAETDGVGIRVVLSGADGNRQGFAYTGSLDDASLQTCLREARDNASFGTPDPFIGLAEPDGNEPATLDLYRESLATFPTAEKIELAMELERLVRAGDSRIRSLRSAGYGDGLLEVAIASTTGIFREYRRTGVSIAAYAIAGTEDDTQTGFGYSVGRSADELDVAKAAAMAVERSTRLLGSTKPTSRRTTIVFDPYVTSSLLSILGGTLNAEAVMKGRSLFADRVGEAVAIDGFSLIDQPTNPLAFGASPIDAEGLATRELPLIRDGVLQGFVHNTVTARRMGNGTKSTGSAVRGGFKGTPGVGCRALTIAPGTLSQEEILAKVGNGVLVQSVSGIHSGVNPVSGDFSVGAEGLLIENGQLGAPIREFTIASTLQRMLMEIVAVGNDLEWLPGGSAGVTLAIEGVSLSGA